MQQLNIGSLQRPARGAWPSPETSLARPDARLCVWEGSWAGGLAAGAQARPGAARTSAARHRARFPAEEESRGSTARGRPPSAEEAAKLTHRRCPRGWGSPAEGQQLGESRLSRPPKAPSRGLGMPLLCSAGFSQAAEERRLKQEQSGRTLGEKKSRSQAPCPCCLP